MLEGIDNINKYIFESERLGTRRLIKLGLKKVGEFLHPRVEDGIY